MSIFHTTQRIGEVVSILPQASEILKEFRIDFCCGGHRPLSEAIKEQNLDEKMLLSKLEKAYEEAKRLNDQVDYREMTSSQLIDYIVGKHHVFVKRVLPEISELTATILRVHGPSHRDLFQVHKLFHTLKTELEQHLIKEEEILFPMIKRYEAEPSDDLYKNMKETTAETEEEHEAAGDILKELREITAEYTVPQDGCGTYRRTFETLEELEADLFQHIHLENNILFHRLGIGLNEAGSSIN
ncbi:MAG: ric [Bacillota bacterium]|nr:ric [Bacillota bacterium]